MKKKVPFVHSSYPRREGDFYPTLDPRCVYALVSRFSIQNVIDICAPSGSGIVDTFRQLNYAVMGVGDAFAPLPDFGQDIWIVTNPPYVRPDVDNIICKQIDRVVQGQVFGFACLLRAYFDYAASRASMFEHPQYFAEIKMRFRPRWVEESTASPMHHFSWHIWICGDFKTPVKLYADGGKP